MNLKREIYFFPLVIILFFINYHYYSFYKRGFERILDYIKIGIFTKDYQYEKIQRFHPYYYLYKIANQNNKENFRVIYLDTKINAKEKINISDLLIRVNYFFYPKIVKPYISLKEFRKLQLVKGDTIITDVNLQSTLPHPVSGRLLLQNSRQEWEQFMVDNDPLFKHKRDFYVFKVK